MEFPVHCPAIQSIQQLRGKIYLVLPYILHGNFKISHDPEIQLNRLEEPGKVLKALIKCFLLNQNRL